MTSGPAHPAGGDAKACFCYILECADGTFYTGWSTDPLRRERRHNQGGGARYTRQRRPVRLVYVEAQSGRSAALRRERQIKKMNRQDKQGLIARTGGGLLPDLESKPDINRV